MAEVLHRWPVRVYWEDTDAGGIVFFASYLRFAERGRTEMLRELGLQQTQIRQDHGVIFVVRKVEVDYLGSAYLDDALEVRTSIEKIGGASMTMRQDIYRGEDLVNASKVIVVSVNNDGKPTRIPDSVRTKMAPYTPAQEPATIRQDTE